MKIFEAKSEKAPIFVFGIIFMWRPKIMPKTLKINWFMESYLFVFSSIFRNFVLPKMIRF
ncbi:MAG: hypothetical protein C0592_13065 [Marinilabiliales bacterium]|nr:MAG: hypothetical protein C0592_13065 [Marinilabiliales bacterium]